MTTIDRTGTAPLGLAVGAISLSASAVVLGLAASTPTTASAARCLFALPVVAALAVAERGRHGALSGRAWIWAGVCGVLFAADMLWWTQAIPEVGAGLSTVLVNVQVALVPLLAWLIDGERIGVRFLWALPVILVGVVLAGGIFEHGVSGTNPTAGTVHSIAAALCYSGFLFLLRRGGQGGQPMQTYAMVLASAAAAATAVGLVGHNLDFAPGWTTAGWLLLVTLTGQLIGWLLVAVYTPKLPSEVSSALLMLMPIGAIVLGALVLVASYAGTARR